MAYIDKNGYKRGEVKHSDLIHRQIARKLIYLKNRKKYPLEFSKYVVHHIDGNKRNNEMNNDDKKKRAHACLRKHMPRSISNSNLETLILRPIGTWLSCKPNGY